MFVSKLQAFLHFKFKSHKVDRKIIDWEDIMNLGKSI